MATQVTVRPLCDSLPARLPVLHIPIRTKLEHNLHFHPWSIQIWRLKKNESALLHARSHFTNLKLFEALRTTRKLHSEKKYYYLTV